ncbi:MAG: beta-galactosidase [Candidatus Coatesbacteria bacterium]
MSLKPALLALSCALALASPGAAAERPPAFTFDARAFLREGTSVFVYAGGFDYVRCPRALWEDRMRKLQRAGCNAVAVSIPWNWHERERGHEDLSDLEQCLDLAGRLGLLVIARPGPFIGDGWNAGGLPAWLAGGNAGWRTDSSACLKWSKRWYKTVCSVLEPRQVTQGGPVILVQLDAGAAGDASPYGRYLDALATAAAKRDLEVPLVTCGTAAARVRPAGREPRVIETLEVRAGDEPARVERALAALRDAQPGAPLAVLSLAGHRLEPVGQPAAPVPDATALDALVKTAIIAGASAVNIEPACAGTSQAYWGAPGLATSWDGGAPVSESGGLTPSWAAMKLLGDFLGTYGPGLARALPEEGARSDTKAVTVRSRADGAARFVAVRNESARPVTARITVPGGSPLTVALKPRQAKLLVAGAGAEGLVVDRLAVQVQAMVRQGARRVLLLADEPGTWPVTARLDGSAVTGTAAWGKDGKLTILPRGVVVWGQPPARAARTWVVETTKGPAIVSTGAYDLRHSTERAGSLVLEVDALPGPGTMRVLLPGSATRLIDVPFWTRPLPFPPIRLEKFRVAAERPGDGEGWERLDGLASLGDLDRHAEGFVRYRARFAWNGEEALALGFLDDDAHLVLVNGVLVPGLSGTARTGIAELSRLAKPGDNLLEVLLENRGRPDSGPGLDAAKGLARAVLLPRYRAPSGTALASSGTSATEADWPGGTPVAGWELAPRLARAWERGESADWANWRTGTPLPAALAAGGPVVWFRTSFTLAVPPGWNVAWKLVLKSRQDARIFLNGVQIGNAFAAGPQTEFFLAEPFLKFGSLGNELALAVIRGGAPLGPVAATIEPYRESSTYTHVLEVPLEPLPEVPMR